MKRASELLLRELIAKDNLPKYLRRNGKVNRVKMRRVLNEIFNKNRNKVERILGIRKSIENIDLFDLIKRQAPEGITDEEIEKAVTTLTRNVLRQAGALGRKLRGFKGRKVQMLEGKPGFWVSRGPTRYFIFLEPDDARRLSQLSDKDFAIEVSRKLQDSKTKIRTAGRKLTAAEQALFNQPNVRATEMAIDSALDGIAVIGDILSFL